jgi:hypothetical protein
MAAGDLHRALNGELYAWRVAYGLAAFLVVSNAVLGWLVARGGGQ